MHVNNVSQKEFNKLELKSGHLLERSPLHYFTSLPNHTCTVYVGTVSKLELPENEKKRDQEKLEEIHAIMEDDKQLHV